MISGKGVAGVERSLGHPKYETTAFISEEGLRSDASMVFNPQATILGIALEEGNMEEMHYHLISFHKGTQHLLRNVEKGIDEVKTPDGEENKTITWFEEEQDIDTHIT